LKEKWLYAPAIGELHILIKCIVGCIEVEMALCPSNRRVAYCCKVYGKVKRIGIGVVPRG
jgi:hypothetical protein